MSSRLKNLPLFKQGFITLLILAGVGLSWGLFQISRELQSPQNNSFIQWFSGNEATRTALSTVQRQPCPGAPFILPADGFIGLLYDDPRGPYSERNPHQGIDIFSNTPPGMTPVYAAYRGYVHRELDWRSTLIMRVPEDPLQPERQIWLYYTHMADREGNDFIEDAFPPGTTDFYVEQGTRLGYTGNYNGGSVRGVSTHLHFSIIQDDGRGRYTNELDFENSINPDPYLNMNLNYPNSGPIDCNS